ncbi:hypothetical protein NDU88_011248 [Pleurodeles waltl]|uniref:Uncharacterized protein n=1 Tax=Pleurodeles waltl TaxID=8319 RepID=A0AAV7R0V2_PLEWA|nr:hypothetical protein NDU88_011248 [Pleurodeles waltl]
MTSPVYVCDLYSTKLAKNTRVLCMIGEMEVFTIELRAGLGILPRAASSARNLCRPDRYTEPSTPGFVDIRT